MNKVIEAGDTVTAVAKVGAALGVVYVVYKLYSFSKDVKASADSVQDSIESAKQSSLEFVTETINPASKENFINQSAIGKTLTPVFDLIFDFVGVGK